jgi:methyl-accepting chemotaxis protein
MMSIIHKIRTSFTTQLTLWVASLVTVISAVVIGLLAMFSQDVIFDETVDTTLQAMETTALRIDNTLRQKEMSARLEGGQVRANRAAIDRLIEENDCLAKLHQTLPNAKIYVTRRDSTQLGIFIAGEESGYRKMEHEDREMFIFTQPLGDRPFVLTAVCPAEDVYGRYSRMQWFLLLRGVVGVLILLIVLYAVVGRHLRPLHRLADSAQSIANGNLDTPIPDAHHEHEAGRLQNSLAKMQQALKAYMTEMQQKQVTLSKQNTDLKAAYAEVQAYEVKKTNFVRDMTAQMAKPVESLCQQAETICRDAATMTREEMAQRQAVIMKDSETITQLLDKLMKETAL